MAWKTNPLREIGEAVVVRALSVHGHECERRVTCVTCPLRETCEAVGLTEEKVRAPGGDSYDYMGQKWHTAMRDFGEQVVREVMSHWVAYCASRDPRQLCKGCPYVNYCRVDEIKAMAAIRRYGGTVNG